jgi:glycosyltransferase involved in cell wall biosynthesis
MQPKKIFIEAQRLFRSQKHGMDVVALELLQRMSHEQPGYDMEVLVKADEDICLQGTNSMKVTMLKNSFYPLWEQWLLPRFTAANQGTLLHCTGNTAPLWGSTPLLVTIHDLIFLEDNYLLKKDGGSLYQRFGNTYRSLVVPRIARKARFIITVSEYQRQLIMQRLQVPAEKIAVVYNGADERFYVPVTAVQKSDVQKKYQLPDAPFILFLANTEPRKNTDGVIKAFAQFCAKNPTLNHQLVIKGIQDDLLVKKINDNGAAAYAHRIKRIGYIGYHELPVIYQMASMLWFPSFSEGFGLPIVEAMAGGTPVITSNCSVMPEIAGDAAMYINPHEPQELADAAASIANHHELANILREKGKQRAQQFTWEKSVAQLLSIYQQLAA